MTGRWRGVLATTLVLLGAVLAPPAVAAAWAREHLTDTQAFVATFAPLARDPAVQDAVAAQATAAVERSVDVDAYVRSAFDALADQASRPRTQAAVRSLAGPVADAVHARIARTAGEVVRSEAFATLWDQSLTLAHAQLSSAASGPSDAGVLTVDETGGVGIRLGPVVAALKDRLVAQGVPLASSIPTVDRTIVVVTIEQVPAVRRAYHGVVVAGLWAPVASGAAIVAGVAVARRRRRALLVAAVAVTVLTLLTLVGLALGRSAAASALASDTVTPAAVRAAYAQVVSPLRGALLLVGGVALVVGLLSLLSLLGVAGAVRPALAPGSEGSGSEGSGSEGSSSEGSEDRRDEHEVGAAQQ